MNGIGQVLATGGTTIAGVAVGAGLTFLFGALTRRHQEEREKETRWYEARFRAYADLFWVIDETFGILRGQGTKEKADQVSERFGSSLSQARLVASPEVETSLLRIALMFSNAFRSPEPIDEAKFLQAVEVFRGYARKDLGH
jgi:hypothetical protein